MAILSGIGSFFTFWLRAGRKYKSLKNNEEKRDKSVSLGVRSIVQTLICGVLAVFCIWGLSFCAQNLNAVLTGSSDAGFPILSIIGVAAFGLATLALFVQGVIGGLIYLIYQFKLNKRAIRYVALVIWLLAIIALIVFAVLMLAEVF